MSGLQGYTSKGSLGMDGYFSLWRSWLIWAMARRNRGPSCRWMPRWTARRSGKGVEAPEEEDDREVRDEREDEDEHPLRDDVSLEQDEREFGGDGDGDGGGESASARVSFGREPKRDCCSGVR